MLVVFVALFARFAFDFGCEAEVDKITLALDPNGALDAWKSVTAEFSDGSQERFALESGKALHEFTFEKRRCVRVKLQFESAALPPKERECVHLHYYMGYKLSDIAGMTGQSTGTVKSHLNRARKKLSEMLGEEIEE